MSARENHRGIDLIAASAAIFAYRQGLLAPEHRARNSMRLTLMIQRSSVVERSAVNRLVVGSNPTAGANF
jgi:hypothetical protein